MYLNNYLLTILNFETKITDEDMYYAINGKYEAIENYKESFNGKLAYSVKDGLELGSIIYGGLGVLKGAKKSMM